MDAVKAWWNEASVRDQLALLILGGCVALYALFNFVLSPVVEMKETQLDRVAAQQAAFERVKNLAAKVKAQSGNQDFAVANASIERTVERSFSQHGLRVSGFDASGRAGIRVRFDKVQYEKLLAWLFDMEMTQGLRMKDISIAGTTDPGLVSASILIEKNR